MNMDIENEVDINEDNDDEVEIEIEIESDVEEEIQEIVIVDDMEEEEEEDQEEEDQEENDDNSVNPLLLENYSTIFSNLTKDWVLAEIDHKVSKRASECFWKVANKYFHCLYLAKEREARRKKVPQFKAARNTMYQNKVPKVIVEVAYKNNQTGELTVERGSTTPTSKYPGNVYSKMYEMASVQVIKPLICNLHHFFGNRPALLRPTWAFSASARTVEQAGREKLYRLH